MKLTNILQGGYSGYVVRFNHGPELELGSKGESSDLGKSTNFEGEFPIRIEFGMVEEMRLPNHPAYSVPCSINQRICHNHITLK